MNGSLSIEMYDNRKGGSYEDDRSDVAGADHARVLLRVRRRVQAQGQSVDVICTCHFNDGYYEYTDERFLCTCDPSNDKDSCNLIYEKLESDE